MDCVANVKSAACSFRLRLRQNAERNPALDMRHGKRERCCMSKDTNPELRRGVDRMRQRKSKRILTLLVALAVMLSLCTTAYAETESSAPAEPTASEQAAETVGTAEPSAEASPSAAESAEPTETPEPSQPAQSEAPSEPAELENTEEPAVADLSSVNSVSEVAALSETGDADGLIINKTAAYDAKTNSYKITLEQYVTGSVTTTTTTKPADIVLVLDVSGSMDDALSTEYVYTEVYSGSLNTNRTYYIKDGNDYKSVTYRKQGGSGSSNGYWRDSSWNTYTPKTSANDSDSSHVQFYTRTSETTTKLDALKDAVNNFIESVATNASENEVKHRIAIVKYAGDKTNTVGNDTCEEGWYTYNYSQIVKGLTDVSTGASDLKEEVNGFTAAGATSADYGMQHAQTVLDSARPDSTKVVVMFTDGEPNHGNYFDTTVANATIKEAKEIKDSGATVYTIGMMEDADDRLPATGGDKDVNKYMHYVSSNYPNATSMSYGGDMAAGVGGDTEKSFYLAADSAAKLNEIFQKISESVNNPSLSLGAETVVKDTVTEYFNMPNVSDVSVYTADCDGMDESGNYTFKTREEYTGAKVAINKESNAITVTNFDYAENYVNSGADGETYGGQKLIVEFTITPKDGFLGGNNVPTNGSDSGIYAKSTDENAIKNYENPTVNVPVKEIAVDVVDKNVYLFGDVTREDMLEGATVKVKDTYGTDYELSLSDGATNFGLDEWQNKFVNITVTKPEGQTGLENDSTFTLSASMTAKEKAGTAIGNANSTEVVTVKDDAKINVFKPVLTFKDGEVDYLDNAPTNPTDYDKNNLVSEAWKYGTTSSADEDVKILGGKPTLELNYASGAGIGNGKITSKDTDIPVKVTVTINKTEVNSYTTFVHDTCTVTDCTWSDENNKNGDPAFLLHPKNTVLTIEKTVSGGEANPNDHFTFTITAPSLSSRTVGATITGADGCSEEHDHGITDAKLNFGSDGKAIVYLKHGESIKLEGLKAGNVTIAEDNGNYTLTAKVDDKTAEIKDNNTLSVSLNRGDKKTAALNNERGGTPILGIDSDNAPFIIIGAAVVICAAGFVFLRRRRGRSDF